ncbi:LysE family transporter [Promethearchaeum syntrophicum]|uniref:LysE family transporter n=1 Tax=Promethearchaeum syntrophicum TaxID=2594042 RepID=A0A5B9DAB2_9ARCH|nr:LysE family transporter [Candidatus Prometheoarchaeum syntrophicum]QEE15885.1 LysE type translocator [Candidatus Prometheoarchaeum syntrophicum]
MSFWSVFSVIFLLGLGGAMSPGTLMTYTIFKSLEAKQKAWLVGLFISLGHALIEFLLILLILVGAESLFANPIIFIIIGVLGGSLLIFFGLQILLDVIREKINTSFLSSNDFKHDTGMDDTKLKLYSRHPILGSIIFLMSNPHWWLWWTTAGLSIIVENSVNFTNPSAFWGLIVGKELGVFLWYVSFATAIGFSRKFITPKIYKTIFVICALFMVGYGAYLAFSTLFALI